MTAVITRVVRRRLPSPSTRRTAMIFETDTIAARAWEKETLTALAEYVVETHHAVTRDAIVALPILAAKARGRHGEAHPETGRIEDLVRRLVEDLAPHLAKEEQ